MQHERGPRKSKHGNSANNSSGTSLKESSISLGNLAGGGPGMSHSHHSQGHHNPHSTIHGHHVPGTNSSVSSASGLLLGLNGSSNGNGGPTASTSSSSLDVLTSTKIIVVFKTIIIL